MSWIPDLGQRAMPFKHSSPGNEELSMQSLRSLRHLEPADEGVRSIGVGTKVGHKAFG